MPRVVHFEIHAADVQRAVTFYTEVFGWTSEDWSSFAGSPYYGLVTALTGQRTHGLRSQASDVIQDVCRLA